MRRVFEQGAYADRAMASEAAGLDGRDRALATRIAYGTVQRTATLDHLAAGLLERPLKRIEPAILAALRIGLYQVLFLDGMPARAAVSETVELAKRSSRGGAGLLNAVLRRAAAERDALLESLSDCTPAAAAVMHSVPQWLAELWWDELGSAEARALLQAINQPAESALRVNTLRAGVQAVADELPVPFRRAGCELPEGLVLEGPFDVQSSPLWERGAVMAQSRASMLAARLLGPEPGHRVLDLCAAPGGKTTHMAALMGGRGEVLAIERHRGRAAALERTAARMGAACVRVKVADAREPLDGGAFDRVLVDPPCSGLGTLQSRPDRRWRASLEAVDELAAVQAELLAAGASALAPGGALVYSVCTISQREGGELVAGFLEEHPELRLESERRLTPHRDRTDGFFMAKLRRSPG